MSRRHRQNVCAALHPCNGPRQKRPDCSCMCRHWHCGRAVAAGRHGAQEVWCFRCRSTTLFGPDSTSHVLNSHQCIMQAKMIVIDEVFSLSYDVLACVERTLREVHHTAAPWGGLAVVLSGDPRQCAPVVEGGDTGRAVKVYCEKRTFFNLFNALSSQKIFAFDSADFLRKTSSDGATLATICWLSERTAFPNFPTRRTL